MYQTRSLACSLPRYLYRPLFLPPSLSLSAGKVDLSWWTILLPPLLAVDDSRSLPPGKAVHARYPLYVGAATSNLLVSPSRGDPTLFFLFSLFLFLLFSHLIARTL